jgi:hypothetical protein
MGNIQGTDYDFGIFEPGGPVHTLVAASDLTISATNPPEDQTQTPRLAFQGDKGDYNGSGWIYYWKTNRHRHQFLRPARDVGQGVGADLRRPAGVDPSHAGVLEHGLEQPDQVRGRGANDADRRRVELRPAERPCAGGDR